MPDALKEAYENYYEKYVEKRKREIQLDTIKNNLKNIYLNSKLDSSETMKKNNIVVREVMKKEYKPKDKEELYDFLEDRGLLPLAVTFSKSIENHFNLEKAKVNRKHTVRIYTGSKSPVDKNSLEDRFRGMYDGEGIEELSDHFNKEYTNAKFAESELEEAKEKMLKVLQEEKINSLKTPDLGTIKVSETYDYDPYRLYESLSGKKELYLKDIGNLYEVIILPDEKKATLPKNFKIDGKELEEYKAGDNIGASSFIKKREFNSLMKEGYLGYKFEIPVDPTEFFRSLPVSRTKLQTLVDGGFITDQEFEELYEVTEDEDNISIQILTEGVAEQQKDMFLTRLAEKAQRLREMDQNFVPVPDFNDSLVEVGFDDFSF